MLRRLRGRVRDRLRRALDDGRAATALAQLDVVRARLDRLEAAMEAREDSDQTEARFAEQAAWSAEVRAELLALGNSLAIYREDVEAGSEGCRDAAGPG